MENSLPKGIVKLCDYDDIKRLEGKLKTFVDASIPREIGGDNSDRNKAFKDICAFIVRDFWSDLHLSTDGYLDKKERYLKQVEEKKDY